MLFDKFADVAIAAMLEGRGCVLCRERFTQENYREKDPRVVHKDPFAFACADCLARKGALMVQEQIKAGEYPNWKNF